MSNFRLLKRGGAKDLEGRTPDHIKAEGDVRVQAIALHYTGVIVLVLSAGGIASFFVCPERSRDLWTVIAPIILAAISGTLGFLAGEKSAKHGGGST